jgi:hypothetical protein
VSSSPLTLNLTQTSGAITGTYSSPNGAGGTVSGSVSGNTCSFTLNQTTTDCTGNFNGTGTVSANTLTFTFSGSDCLGTHTNGRGSLTKSTVPAPQSTRLYLSGSSDNARCAAIPQGARGVLCPANPIPVGLNIQSFIYQGSSANWVTTLSGDLLGTGYGLTLQLAMEQSRTATGKAEIILGKGSTETVLFSSEVFTVNSSTFKPFTFTGAGTSANGVSGDRLILRVSCLSGCSASGLGVLLTSDQTSFIDIPSAIVSSQALESTLSSSPYLNHEYDPAMEETCDSTRN